jgi:hypothetical protein
MNALRKCAAKDDAGSDPTTARSQGLDTLNAPDVGPPRIRVAWSAICAAANTKPGESRLRLPEFAAGYQVVDCRQ